MYQMGSVSMCCISLIQHCLKTMEDHLKRQESFVNALMLDMSEIKLKANTCGLSRDSLASVGFPCRGLTSHVT